MKQQRLVKDEGQKLVVPGSCGVLSMLKLPRKDMPRRYYVVSQGIDKKWRWVAKDSYNDKTTHQGEAHASPSKAVRAIMQERKALGVTTDLWIIVMAKKPYVIPRTGNPQ